MIKKRGIEIFKCIILAVLLVGILFLIAPTVAAQIATKDYEISTGGIDKKIKIGNYREVPLTIINKQDSTITVGFSLAGNITNFVKLSSNRININSNSEATINISFFADEMGFFNGSLVISGAINEKIPINFTISDIVGLPVEAIILEITPFTNKVYIGEIFRYKVDIQNLLAGESYNITLHYSIDKLEPVKTYVKNESFFSETESILINISSTLLKKFVVPDFVKPGEYILTVEAEYLGLSSHSSIRFFIAEPVLDYALLGILPIRWLILGIIALTVVLIVYYIYKKQREKKKRYKSKIEFNLLPKPGPRSVKIGKIAETTRDAYFDIDQLTMHTLIAGSTGGGKTVSAEVLIEEALLKGVSVFVFDPTAQWTGFLRKCQNKKMLTIYTQFGMKKSDARAFNGNVHQILNARQIIDIKKYMLPGEIHCFAINRLDPEDIDILVTNTIREIFHANLPESNELKVMIIFDEVHRLLPKFGGSGQGFIMVERGAREFRKWGIGLMLISQVLTDFVGETKANINTEIQMRTRDQGDLDRIKNKYGDYMLQSLLKASTGTGMIENAAYNRGNPYFVSFRPLLHEHARLSDEELENYNKYNEIIDDLDYEIEQLKDDGIDVFDIKLELKMALDKVKSGNFNMVNIYLEGLKPKIKGFWDKLGKQPKKREIKLVNKEELEKEFEKAKKAREEFEKDSEKSKKAEEKKEKTLAPLRLKTGIVVLTFEELIDALSTIDDNIFKQHVNPQKNDFADWVKDIDEGLSNKIKSAKNKNEILGIINNYQQEQQKKDKK